MPKYRIVNINGAIVVQRYMELRDVTHKDTYADGTPYEWVERNVGGWTDISKSFDNVQDAKKALDLKLSSGLVYEEIDTDEETSQNDKIKLYKAKYTGKVENDGDYYFGYAAFCENGEFKFYSNPILHIIGTAELLTMILGAHGHEGQYQLIEYERN